MAATGGDGTVNEVLNGLPIDTAGSPTLAMIPSGDRHADTLAIMTEINRIIESWIRARPDLWFWLHRRWPD